jgi:hypothetical protein
MKNKLLRVMNNSRNINCNPIVANLAMRHKVGASFVFIIVVFNHGS